MVAEAEATTRVLQLQVGELEKELAGERVRRGRAEQRAAAPPPPRESASDSGRIEVAALRQQLALLETHIVTRDAALEEARQRLDAAEQQRLHLEEELRQQRRQQAAEAPAASSSSDAAAANDVRTFTARDVRRKRTSRAWLEPFTMEFIRRLVDETNMSFSAVPKAIALVWSMLFVEPIPDDFIFSSFTASQAFLRLNHMYGRGRGGCEAEGGRCPLELRCRWRQ